MSQTVDSRARLINSAITLMYRRGYTAVGVKEICDHANVNKGSFYYFFPSKRDLVLAALDTQWQLAKTHLLKPVFSSNLPPLERLQQLFCMAVQAQQSTDLPMRGCFFGNLALELSTQDDVIRQKLQTIFEEWTDYFCNTLTEAVEAGQLPEIDVQRTAQAMLAYLEGVALLAKTDNNPVLVEQLAQGVVQLAIPLHAE